MKTCLTWLVVLAALWPNAAGADEFDPAAAYRANCAPCHGVSGRLDPEAPIYPSFESPPADLTEPKFNSMEPGADWFMVIKFGGKPMGLSGQMPAFEGAHSDAEIQALVVFIKGLADTRGYPSGDMNFLRPVRTIKAFPEDEALLITRYEDRDSAPDGRRNTAYYARRLGKTNQVELKLNHVDQGARSELSDVELGYKRAFRSRPGSLSLFAAGLEAEVPLDDDEDEDTVFIPYFSLAKGLSDRFTLQATARSHLPTGGVDEGDLELDGVVHWMRSAWPRSVFPALELTLLAPYAGERDFEATLIPQAFVGLNRRGHVALAVGVQLPLTDLEYEYRVHAFLLWDIGDGAFWQGW